MVCIITTRFHLTVDITNLYPFIQGSLEWPFSELFSANVSLCNQFKYIPFNIFSCRIVIISYKTLIITGISNEETNEFNIYGVCRNVHWVKSVRIRIYSGPHFPTFGLNTARYGGSLGIQSECGKIRTRITPNTYTFYAVVTMNILPTRTRFFILSSRKIKACRSSKLNFSSSYFIADDSHVKIVWLLVVVFIENDILHFWHAHLFKYDPVKVPQNCFNSFNYENQTCIQFSKFSCALDK